MLSHTLSLSLTRSLTHTHTYNIHTLFSGSPIFITQFPTLIHLHSVIEPGDFMQGYIHYYFQAREAKKEMIHSY
jgi:hypothetical protein